MDLGKSIVQKPDRYGFFERSFPPGAVIARGGGLSYAAASFGRTSVSIDMTSFDRILEINPSSRIIEVEAGARLWDVFTRLASLGLYLPVQPGYGAITIGGCIAADVHGKNQLRDGTFSEYVESLRLYHPSHGFVNLSRTQAPHIFAATCGGYGSTGVILSARIRAAVLPGHYVRTEVRPIGNLSEVVPLLTRASQDSDFLYTWHDFNRSGDALGQGVLTRGRFVDAATSAAPKLRHSMRLTAKWRATGTLMYGNTSLQLLNLAYRYRLCNQPPLLQPLAEALFPLHGSERYFWAYGRGGFHEYQAIVSADAFASYYTALHRITRKAGICAPLAAAKLFAGTPALLRFCGPGICFALNLPRSRHSQALLCEFDAVLRDVQGRPNIIKDSRLPMHIAASTYPDLDRLRTTVRQWDPARLFRSELTERLQL